MGSRGPIAKRANLAVEPMAKAPAPPRSLGGPGAKAWKAVWAQCAPWLTEGDRDVVERLARLHDERAELLALIKRAGRTSRGSTGQLVTHPYVDQLRAVETSILRHEQVLGVGAAHRARLGIAVVKLAKESNAGRIVEMYRARLESSE